MKRKNQRTKTFQGIVDQYHRIAKGTGEHPSLRHEAFKIYWRYMTAMNCNERYWNMRDHIVNCIEGRVSSNGERMYLYPELGNMDDEEKRTLAGRIADTVVQFTRKEYAGF